MCGIAGWFGAAGHWDADLFRIGLEPRGPDGSGVWSDDKATLVHTRLAVIGLGAVGAQPVSRSTGSERGNTDDAVLVFNGEIYNYRELGGAQAACDTEVLMNLLQAQGESCLLQLAGMFAFAFYRPGTGEALLARDAFGIKPLYYRIDGDTLAFSSDSRLLRQAGDRVDAEGLRDFFLWGSVPEPATVVKKIRQIPAGHLLAWKAGRARITRWHHPSARVRSTTTRREAAAKARAALEKSVARHLVSDVPVGLFLSGGIDSTVLLALARQQLGRNAAIRTYSIGFDDPDLDESAIARKTAELFGTIHTEWRMTSAEGEEEIHSYLRAVDQPTIDGFNTWCVAKMAAKAGVKVVLSGVGGDEWFAGYASFKRLPWLKVLHDGLPEAVRNFAAGLLGRAGPGSPLRRFSAFFRGRGTWLEAFHAQRGIFNADEAEILAHSLTGAEPLPPDWDAGELPDEPREIAGWLEVTRYMRNQLLRDSDAFSMAQGVELRVPFVDAQLAEALLEISPHDRLAAGKQLLLDAVPEIPSWVRNRRKQGFVFPFPLWMKKKFPMLLEEANRTSPVPLVTWYRAWSVAAAARAIAAVGRPDNHRTPSVASRLR